MKIRIAYLEEEKNDAKKVEELICKNFPEITARSAERHHPFLHTYLTKKLPRHRNGFNESLDKLGKTCY